MVAGVVQNMVGSLVGTAVSGSVKCRVGWFSLVLGLNAMDGVLGMSTVSLRVVEVEVSCRVVVATAAGRCSNV